MQYVCSLSNITATKYISLSNGNMSLNVHGRYVLDHFLTIFKKSKIVIKFRKSFDELHC